MRGQTSLLTALLLVRQDVEIDAAEPVSRTTALNSAIMMERAEAVRELLVHGAGVETVDRAGWAPLHWAVLSGNLVIAREILQHGSQSVRLGQRSESGTTPLHFAAAMGDDGMVELLSMQRSVDGRRR